MNLLVASAIHGGSRPASGDFHDDEDFCLRGILLILSQGILEFVQNAGALKFSLVVLLIFLRYTWRSVLLRR